MSNKPITPIIYINNHTNALLLRTINSFITLNSCALSQFPISLLSKSACPRSLKPQLSKSLLCQKGVHWSTIFKHAQNLHTPCVIVIPSEWESLSPLHPYIPQLLTSMQRFPGVGMIKLVHDIDCVNTITSAPIIYRRITRDVFLGNGNIKFDSPILLRASRPSSKNFEVGQLKTRIFQKID